VEGVSLVVTAHGSRLRVIVPRGIGELELRVSKKHMTGGAKDCEQKFAKAVGRSLV